MTDHRASGDPESVGAVAEVPDSTPERAAGLRDQAEALHQQAMALENESERLFAQSEIITSVRSARIDLEHAESELADARERLAAAQLAYDPVADDLARVRAELLSVEVAGDLDARLAARTRRLALEEELAPLAEQEQRQRQILDSAQALVTSYERDTISHFRAVLAAAEAALADPPLHSMAELGEVAPQAFSRRCSRLGLLLLFGRPEALRTPDGRAILFGLRPLLRSCALPEALRDEFVAELPPKLRTLVGAYLAQQQAERDLARPAPEHPGRVRLDANGNPVGLPPGHIQVDPATGQPPVDNPLARFPMIDATRALRPGTPGPFAGRYGPDFLTS